MIHLQNMQISAIEIITPTIQR